MDEQSESEKVEAFTLYRFRAAASYLRISQFFS